jgi:hypothetical protein
LNELAAVSNEGRKCVSSDKGLRVGIEHGRDPLNAAGNLGERLKPLASQRGFQAGEAGDVPVRAVEPRDEAAGAAKTIGIVRVSRWRATAATVAIDAMASA